MRTQSDEKAKQSKASEYFVSRLSVTGIIWTWIAVMAYYGPSWFAWISRVNIPVEPLDLSDFADGRLPVLIAIAAGLGVLLIIALGYYSKAKDAGTVSRALLRFRDEISSALTHFACASVAVCAVTGHWSALTLGIAVLCAIVGGALYVPELGQG